MSKLTERLRKEHAEFEDLFPESHKGELVPDTLIMEAADRIETLERTIGEVYDAALLWMTDPETRHIIAIANKCREALEDTE